MTTVVEELQAALADLISRANMVLEDPQDLGDLGKLRIAIEHHARLVPTNGRKSIHDTCTCGDRPISARFPTTESESSDV